MLESGHDEATTRAVLEEAELQLASEAPLETAPSTAEQFERTETTSASDATATVPSRTAWQLVQLSFERTFANPGLIAQYVLASIVVMGGAFAVGALGYATGNDSVFVAMAVLAVVTGIVLVMVNALALLVTVVNEQRFSYWQAWQASWPLLWQFLLLSFVSTVVLWLGLVFLIVPGIVLAVYILLAQVVFVKEGHRGATALARSTELIYGAWWGTLGRLALLMLTIFLISFIVGFVEAFFTGDAAELVLSLVSILLQLVVSIAMLHLIYAWYLERVQLVGTNNPSPSTVKKFRIAAWVGAVAILFFPLVIGATVFSQLNDARERAMEAQEMMLEQQLEMEQILEEEGAF